ncbi:putative Xaa-Pro aminopeptidase P [Caerostris extrusa]|uniref:Xaa-Pro aminopeptidase P n=1 Tax=Caerostris extrusa TaxID=172846 RepID=A0AAV4XX87_CAEEX|nr:putative Xaa-Pro aminopeptidase P [Caerostris extrusa]
MKASGYDAYIVPSIDEHQSKIMTDHDKRREFISGFTGSAGTAVILSKSSCPYGLMGDTSFKLSKNLIVIGS